MEELKGLILSGGRGTRLRPITFTSAKQLCRWPTSRCCSTASRRWRPPGIREVGIIIAPETGDEIREAAGDGSHFGVAITYIVQDEPAGLAHAVLTAEPFLGDAPFVMYLGDNLLQGGMEDLVQDVPRARARGADPAHAGARPAELRRRRAGRRTASVVRLVEKPPEPATDLALVGVYMFTPLIHEAARAIEPSRARRAGDHRRDPVARRRRPARRAAHRARLVEGHRPPRRHARGQPADPRHRRAPDRRRRCTRRRSTAAWSSRPARCSSARPCAGRRSSAPAPSCATPTSGRTPRSAATA